MDWNEVEKYIQYRYDTIVEKRKAAAAQRDGPEVDWEITNFVCTARTDEQIPIRHVTTTLRSIIKYIPHSFAAAYLSLRFPEMNFRATIAIFATGQLVIRGTKHLEHARFAALAVIALLKKRCGIKYLRLTADSFKVHNIVAHIYMYFLFFSFF
jgi:TATA-box binding protein (TBP) (component of TFIID and TFIIIB)